MRACGKVASPVSYARPGRRERLSPGRPHSNMTANEYLSKIQFYETQIARLEETLDDMKANYPGIMGTDYNAPRVPSYPKDNIGAYVARVLDTANNVLALKTKYLAEKNERIQRIQRVDNSDYADILMRRYVLYQTWGKIADEMLYSKMHIFRLKKRALLAFEEANNDLFCDSKREAGEL